MDDHDFQNVYYVKPVLCSFCHDYIWGTGCVGKCCMKCLQHRHIECCNIKSLTNESTCVMKESDANNNAILKSQCRLDVWESDNICDWLPVVNLFRYCNLFLLRKLNGRDLRALTEQQLQNYHITDSFHRTSILQAVSELVRRQSLTLTDNGAVGKWSGVDNSVDHRLVITTFYKSVTCAFCSYPLFGLVQQGLQCASCGLILHKQCCRLGIPKCEIHVTNLECHNIFRRQLIDQARNADGVPIVLFRLCNFIEEEGRSHSVGYLYNAYRLSPDSSRIYDLRTIFHNSNIESLNFNSFTVREIGALVKSLLREIECALIPEELYSDVIDMIDKSGQEIKDTLSKWMLKSSYNAFCFVMKHLCTVWSIDYVNHNINQPEKLIDVFKTIVIRPPWKSIILMAHNVDKHATILKKLLTEADWGVAVPTYPIELFHDSNDTQSKGVVNENMPNWLWGYVSNDAVVEAGKDAVDGSFLVYISNSSSSYHFQLYVKCSGENHFLPIHESDKKFGLSNESFPFSSLNELIEFYTHNALDLNNVKVTLSNPISFQNHSIESTTREFKKCCLNLYRIRTNHDDILNRMSILNREMIKCRKTRESNSAVRKKFLNQETILKSNSDTLSADVRASSQEVITARVDMLSSQITALDNLLKNFSSEYRELNGSLPLLNENLAECEDRLNFFNAALLMLGYKAKFIDFMTLCSFPYETIDEFYVKDCDRKLAREYLKGHKDGTFLVRDSSRSTYAISMNFRGFVYDCMIGFHAGCYCLAHPEKGFHFRKFSSIVEMINYFTNSSFYEYNSILDMKLGTAYKQTPQKA